MKQIIPVLLIAFTSQFTFAQTARGSGNSMQSFMTDSRELEQAFSIHHQQEVVTTLVQTFEMNEAAYVCRDGVIQEEIVAGVIQEELNAGRKADRPQWGVTTAINGIINKFVAIFESPEVKRK